MYPDDIVLNSLICHSPPVKIWVCIFSEAPSWITLRQQTTNESSYCTVVLFTTSVVDMACFRVVWLQGDGAGAEEIW